jgi:hypothetical protein
MMTLKNNIHKVKIHPGYKGLRKKKVHPETGHASPEWE